MYVGTAYVAPQRRDRCSVQHVFVWIGLVTPVSCAATFAMV